MSWWKFLLFPFAILYDLGTRIRNLFFDLGLMTSEAFAQVQVVSVGNLSVGGTGKTPMVEFLIRWALSKDLKTAVLSKGYGRQTKGVRLAEGRDNASTIGDEPYCYYQLYGEQIKVVVAEKRVDGMRALLAQAPGTQLVILDDAFQHRSLHRDFNLLLTTESRPFWKDFLMPMGRLRESGNGHVRADHLVITKSSGQNMLVPNLQFDGMSRTKVLYGKPIMVSGEMEDRVIGLAGLADNGPFFEYLESTFQVEKKYAFRDHHKYINREINRFLEDISDGVTLLCTSKDAVKLMDFEQMKGCSWGYIPIEVGFIEGKAVLLNQLDSVLNE